MQVKIDTSCFLSEGNHSDLDAIFSLFLEEQHKWIDIDLEEIKKTDWYQGLGSRQVVYLAKMFVGSTRKSNFKKIIQVLNDDESEFNVIEAKIFLKQPLTVVVENYEHEPIFINKIFAEFDSSKELIKAKNMQWLSYENGGGANDNTVKGKLNESYDHDQLSKEKSKYLRCFVIKDSDRKYCIKKHGEPTMYQSISKAKTEFLELNKVPFHILHKREKENYMPDLVFDSFIRTSKKKDDKKEFAKVYLKLSNEQKDFFDLEKGFTEKIKNERRIVEMNNLEPQVKELYNNLSLPEYNILGKGLPYPKFKSDFSKNFSSVKKLDLEKKILHQPTLISIVNPNDKNEYNEFEHLIREIKYLL